MKIDNSVQSVSSLLGGASKQAKAGVGRSTTASGDSVELSSLSARLQEISGEMGSAPAVDSGRVAEIKQAITEGRFQINAERIADGLIDDVRQLLAGRG